jgi:ABC-type branched-subunit amino acid transport system permease subunit
MDINSLRKYRIDIESIPFYNEKSHGIALLDLTASFIGAFLLDALFGASNVVPVCKNKRLIYYLLVIPIGIIVHHIFAHIQAVLNGKPFLFPEEITFLNKKLISLEFNVYKVLVVGLLILTGYSCKI